MEFSDEQIAERVQKGDTESFGILVERYQQKLIRYGSRMLFNKSDLEDIVQEVFIKAFRNFQSFDTSRKFSTWIYRIAHNEFINHGKKFSRQITDYFDLEVLLPHKPADKNLADEFDKNQQKTVLENSLSELDAKYAEPLVLYYLEGLDYKEIAEVLHLPIGTVGVRIKRAKEQLKQHLHLTVKP